MREYDLVVVGSGAGLTVLEHALEHGLSCALVERSLFGGTCLTRGCIPSKILVHPADLIREARHARRIGLDFRLERVDWPLLTARMRSQIDLNAELAHGLSHQEGLAIYKGTGSFTGPATMQVALEDGTLSEVFTGRKFLIAAGGRAFIPPVEGLAETGYIDAESFFGSGFPERPWHSLAIIGGGAIGAEFAHIFSAFGTHVSIIELLPHLVANEEHAVSSILEDTFRRSGIDVLTGFRTVRAFLDGGLKALEVENSVTGIRSVLHCEEILVAAGLQSNADLLQLEHTSIRTDARGWIETNEFLETTQPNVWAIGDINGKFPFRHKANHEADICAASLLGHASDRKPVDYTKVPWAIYTWPQIAHVGLTEAQVRASGRRYLIGERHYSSVAKGFAMGYEPGDPDDGFVKLIADDQFRILGAHIIGPQAAILIQPIVYLMNTGFSCRLEPTGRLFRRMRQQCDAGGTFLPLQDSMVIHPSLSEVVGWVTSTLHWAIPEATGTEMAEPYPEGGEFA